MCWINHRNSLKALKKRIKSQLNDGTATILVSNNFHRICDVTSLSEIPYHLPAIYPPLESPTELCIPYRRLYLANRCQAMQPIYTYTSYQSRGDSIHAWLFLAYEYRSVFGKVVFVRFTILVFILIHPQNTTSPTSNTIIIQYAAFISAVEDVLGSSPSLLFSFH